MLALTPPHQGGLLPLSLGLLHPQEIIRECTVDILNELRQYPVRFPLPYILLSPHLITISGLLDRGSVPPIIESFPKIRIRETGSDKAGQDCERTESATSTSTATTDSSALCVEDTFKPKRIESYWWLNGVPGTG